MKRTTRRVTVPCNGCGKPIQARVYIVSNPRSIVVTCDDCNTFPQGPRSAAKTIREWRRNRTQNVRIRAKLTRMWSK